MRYLQIYLQKLKCFHFLFIITEVISNHLLAIKIKTIKYTNIFTFTVYNLQNFDIYEFYNKSCNVSQNVCKVSMCVYYDSKISRYQQYYCNSVKGTTLLPSERQIHVRQKKFWFICSLPFLFSLIPYSVALTFLIVTSAGGPSRIGVVSMKISPT